MELRAVHRARMTDNDILTLKGPDMVVAAIPHLLGFTPENSLVLVVLNPSSSVRVTVRLDLLCRSKDRLIWNGAFREAVAAAGAPGSDVIVVAYGSSRDSRAVKETLRLADRELIACVVLDRLLVVGERWFSLDCGDTNCCPAEGHSMSSAMGEAIGKRLGSEAVLSSRSELARTLASDPSTVERVAACIATVPPIEEPRRDIAIEHAMSRLRTGDVEFEDAALVMVALRDVPVRDTLIWDLLSLRREEWPVVAASLREILRSAPSADLAPAATLLSIMEWQCGRGAHAMVAVECAMAADPDYRLAELIHMMLIHLPDPKEWLAVLRTLPREVCRRGHFSGAA